MFARGALKIISRKEIKKSLFEGRPHEKFSRLGGGPKSEKSLLRNKWMIPNMPGIPAILSFDNMLGMPDMLGGKRPQKRKRTTEGLSNGGLPPQKRSRRDK